MIQAFYLPPKSEKVETVAGVKRIAALFAERDGVLWIDMEGGEAADLDLLARFGVHPVALDICREVTAQPLVHDYDDYFLLVTHAVDFRRAAGELATLEVDIFCGRRTLVTYHRDPVRSIADLRQQFAANGSGAHLSRGVQFFLHTLLDRMIDNFGPTLEAYDEALDALEDEIFRRPTDAVLQTILDLKRKVATLGRVAAAQRDAIGRVARGELPQVTKPAQAYWRDLYDHLVRMVQATDLQRDMLSTSRDTYLSVISNRMNEIMKVLTVIATIFIPLTFIAGVYGMNFKHMPELSWRWAYPAVWALMGAVAATMLYWFRRKKWL